MCQHGILANYLFSIAKAISYCQLYYKINLKTLRNTEGCNSSMESFNILSDRLEIKSKSTDDNVIEHLSMATGVVYSDEQLEIMRHRGGMAIMAAAGSGKTTVLTHLIAKRILSGEIADPSKILCTTYSKAGATEMEERINKLLATVGISKKVMVKTMHAFYLLILQHFGYSLKLVDGLQRTKFIREACSKAELKLKDEELQTLDSLLSYQVNNLMSDKELTQSYIYTLDEVPIEKYSLVKAWYTELKKKANMMDFDDMQLYVYFWLCLADENTKTAVKSWINQTWDEFYIDEAQDISKIQMAILRKMCTDSSKVVFIGDDDQCLVKGTKVSTPKGLVNIEEVSAGDEVYTGDKSGKLVHRKVSRVSKKQFRGNIVKITTDSGKVVMGTPDHTGFVELEDSTEYSEGCMQFKKCYSEIEFLHIQEGMFMPIADSSGSIASERVKSVELEEYNGYVYDISVPATRNFVANGVIVHNCIYEWRGADPSLLVNITGYYDIEKFILSTNYRCRAEIVNTAANGIKYNTKRTDKTMKPFNHGGQIKIINTASCRKEATDKSPNIYTMTKYAFIYITDLIRSGVSPDKIAVLSRNNNQLSILNNMLFRDGVYCEFTKDMQFTGNQVYKEIKQVVELAKDEYEPQLTQSMLWKLVPYFSTANAKVMADFQANSGLKFSDVIGCFLEECCNIRINWEKPYGVSIPEASKGRLRALARNISENQANSLKVLYRASIYNGSVDEDSDKRKIENEYRRIANYLGLYSLATMGFLYKTEDKQRTCDGYVEYFKKMVKDWGIEKTLRFLNVSQQYESGAVSAITPRVTMSTIHGAKGKEWEHVVIFADDNITSPAFTSLNDMARKGVSTSDLHKLIEEDRRLHYVAMTRAKETLAIITYENNISTYTLEAFGLLDGLDELGIGSTMNEIVLNMAKCGKLRDEIVSKAKDLFFSENSKYKIEIDLSKVDKPTEIEFNLAKEQSKPKVDLNSAGISFSLSDDDEDDDTEQAKGSQALFAYEGMSLSLGEDDDDEEYYP